LAIAKGKDVERKKFARNEELDVGTGEMEACSETIEIEQDRCLWTEHIAGQER